VNYEDLRKIQRVERNVSKVAVLEEDFYDQLRDLFMKYKNAESEEDRRTFTNISKVAKDIMERREQKILRRALRCVRAKELDSSNLVSHEKHMFEALADALQKNHNEFKNLLLGETYIMKKKEEKTVKTIPEVSGVSEPEESAEPVDTETTIIEAKPVPEPEKIEEFKKDEKTGIIELPETKADRPERPAVSEQSAGSQEDLNTIVVRILKSVPKFVSSDMKELGPFEENQIVKLPRKEADLLSNRNFAELV